MIKKVHGKWSERPAEHLDADSYMYGKALAIADWQAKKEQEEYERLFVRLYKRNWARAERARDPEAARERCRAWRAANQERVRKTDRARLRRKRAAAPLFCRCEECGKTWQLSVGMRRARFCERKCRNRWHGLRRKRNRGLRNMRLVNQIFAVLRGESLTARQAAEAIPKSSPGSVATKMSQMEGLGQLVSTGGRGRRYSIPKVRR